MRPLYIGLRGLAGSGKDTVGKMLSFILDHYSLSLQDARIAFKGNYRLYDENRIYVIAFADQLKKICSDIFGVPIDAFYNGNKANAWVCINRDFHYTETRPEEGSIITASDYYSGQKTSVKPMYMSIREIMVYVGTYMLQRNITENIFINIVENKIKRHKSRDLQYVLLTDVRFEHELDYVHEKSGVVINITNDRVTALQNIAELSLNDDDTFDFNITNNGTYDDLFEEVYNLVHENKVFENDVVELETRTNDVDTYLRTMYEDENMKTFQLCTSSHINRMNRSLGEIDMIDPAGGPIIKVGETIAGTDIVPSGITLGYNMKFVIDTVKNRS